MHVDSDTRDEQTAGAQRRCTVHEVVDRAINGARQEYVFEVPTEEDDKVRLTNTEVSRSDLLSCARIFVSTHFFLVVSCAFHFQL